MHPGFQADGHGGGAGKRRSERSREPAGADRGAVRRDRSFRGRPEEVHEVRSFVAAAAAEAGVDRFAAILAASELATNVVVHAGTPFTVTTVVRPGRLRVELSDGSGAMPVAQVVPHESAHGRGVRIVEAMTDRWGSGPTAGGKVVWFELSQTDGATG